MAGKGRVVVLGVGAAGNQCARALGRQGYDVTAIEPDRFGGTCLWRGCIPKKALYTVASAARTIASAEQFGITTDGVSIDWQSALAWKWHAQESYAGDQKQILASTGATPMAGNGRFVDVDQVEVDGKRISFDHAVIATGSVAVMPPIPGIELADTSDDAIRYPEIPATLVVVGAGFIAMEMAGIYASLGAAVSVVTRPDRVLEMLDDDLSSVARRHLEALGVRFYTGCTLTGIDGTTGSLRALLTDAAGSAHVLDAERVLVAVGRRPHIDELDLKSAGVEVDERGHLVLDRYLRTTNPQVWAAGDAAGGMMQTPVASMEGRTVAASIMSGTPTEPDCHALPVTAFTVPQLATVGLTERRAAETGRPVDVHSIAYDGLGAAVVAGQTDGFAKLLVDPSSGVVLGGKCTGPAASDMIYACALAVGAELRAEQLTRILGVHPSWAEAVHYAGW